jgi:hypothetical protein
MKEQTAVEWLTMEAMKFLNQAITGTLNEDTIEDDVSTIITKAKEKERHQIIEAHGAKLKNSKGETNFQYWYTGEDYYNDTFKNTNDETI